jgi:hypothetical protein
MLLEDPSTAHVLPQDLKEKTLKAGTNAVNVMAGKTRKEGRANIKSEFTNRNDFTAGSVQYTTMHGTPRAVEDIKATVGITQRASYMARQEKGGLHTPQHGKTLAIPTDVARGGVKSNKVQLKVKYILNKEHRVHGDPRPFARKLKSGKTVWVQAKTYKSQKAWLAARTFVAHSRNLFLPLGGGGGQRNIFRVTDFKAIGKDFHRKAEYAIEEVYNFEYDATMTTARPWFFPACELVARDAQKIFNSEMKKLGM